MRALVITLILFGLMAGGIIGNAFFIHHITEKMNQAIDELPEIDDPLCHQKTQEIKDYWEKKVSAVGLSVSYLVVDRVSEQAATLEACASCGDRFGFETARALLLDAIGDMCRLEHFCLENIL